MDLLLLDAVAVIPVADSRGTTTVGLPKILRVPRAARDFVRSRMSSDEHYDVVRAAANVLFGKNWRSGRIRLVKRASQVGPEMGPGNEHSVCMHLINHAKDLADTLELSRAVAVGLRYASQLKSQGRYRDGHFAARELTNLLKSIQINDCNLDEELVELRIIGAQCARMTGKHNEAIEMFSDVASTDIRKDNSRLLDIHLGLAGRDASSIMRIAAAEEPPSRKAS